MTLARLSRREWPLGQLHEEINRLFNSAGGLVLDANTQPFLSGWAPAIDIYEDADNLYVRAEVPGMKKDAIDLSLHDDVLTLSGERQAEFKGAEAKLYRAERFAGRFSRAVSLPTRVVADKVQATYKDGILTVTLPKAEEAKARQIQVNVN